MSERASFGVVVTTISGERKLLDGLRPDDVLVSLIEKAADALCLPAREVRLCAGVRAFEDSEIRETLERLEIKQGLQLTALRQHAKTVIEYRVLQGPLLKKPGPDPAAQRCLKVTRPVGSKVSTTGNIWKGPSGGEWVELDVWLERPGWMLIDGPGFDVKGPLLEKVLSGEEDPILLSVRSPTDDSQLSSICVKPSQTIAHAKVFIAARHPELQPQKITCWRDRPRGGSDTTQEMSLTNFPTDWLLPDSLRIQDSPLKDGDELIYVYLDAVTTGGAAQEDVLEAVDAKTRQPRQAEEEAQDAAEQKKRGSRHAEVTRPPPTQRPRVPAALSIDDIKPGDRLRVLTEASAVLEICRELIVNRAREAELAAAAGQEVQVLRLDLADRTVQCRPVSEGAGGDFWIAAPALTVLPSKRR